MQPTFIHLPPKKVVGLGARFISILSPDRNNMNIIPALWHQFMQQFGQIPHRKGEASFGLVEDLPPGVAKSNKDEMFYIACTEVSEINPASPLPAGMISRDIPAGRYAVFTHKGKLDGPAGLGETTKFIYQSWVPEAGKIGVVLREGAHIEVYDKRFIIGSDASEFDILLPVQ